MSTPWNSGLRNAPRYASRGRKFRRLGVERVEDRRLLAAIAFQTGMEAQLGAVQGNAAASLVAPLVISPLGSIAPNQTWAQPAIIGPDIVAFPQGVASFAFEVMPDIIPSGGGSVVMRPILGVDLPSAPTLPARFLNPIPSPIDIGQVPPTMIQGPMASPESTAAPIVAGSEPSTVAPIGTASKPDVEGNRGKSQLIDVASSQGQQTVASVPSSPVLSPSAVAEVSFTNGNDRGMPTASGVDALLLQTARGNESGGQAESDGQAASMTAFGGEDEGTVAAGVIADDSAKASDPRSPDQLAAVAMAVPDSVSARLATASDGAVAGSSIVTEVKPEEKAGKPHAAERYCAPISSAWPCLRLPANIWGSGCRAPLLLSPGRSLSVGRSRWSRVGPARRSTSRAYNGGPALAESYASNLDLVPPNGLPNSNPTCVTTPCKAGLPE